MLSWVSKIRKSKKTAIILAGVFVVVFLFLGFSFVNAQALDLGLGVGAGTGLAGGDIRLIIARVIRAVLSLLGIIALSIMLYAGFLIMTSGGNEEKVAKGKKTMINAVIGLFIILASWAIVQFIINALGTGTYLATDSGQKPKIELFAGSAALGEAIKDHYPVRDQVGVARNTKIIVTFTEAIDPSTIIENTNNTIKLEKISKTINLKEKFITSWINDDDVTRAKWKAKLLNTTIEDIELISSTRLKTWSWIIFEIIGNANIPPAQTGTWNQVIPWETEVNIISKIRDKNWSIAWIKANIWTWVLLTIPWLNDPDNKIYAVISSETKWWSSSDNRILSQTDINNAKSLLKERLIKESLENIKLEIIKDNQLNNSHYDILNVNNIIYYNNLIINEIWELKIWEYRKDFELTWSVEIETYIYNKETVINKLKKTIKDLSLEELENIDLIDNKSLRVSNTIYKEEEPLQVKATMEIEAYYSQNFLNKNNAYIEKLKWHILWLNINEAKKILLNNNKISNIEIETRPFFIKTISNIPDNIIFKIEND